MHEVSRFYGIIVEMECGDTPPAHFHVRYGGAVALIGIEKLTMLKGRLPPRALGLVMEWADLHRAELRQAWKRGQRSEDLGKIAPLE
ncbi:MAG: DUF4160 domain-containing protein [Acidobacteriota bacterium]|nr:DUF4160 domain-containing protein [Acidobacteriota bacterium]